MSLTYFPSYDLVEDIYTRQAFNADISYENMSKLNMHSFPTCSESGFKVNQISKFSLWNPPGKYSLWNPRKCVKLEVHTCTWTRTKNLKKSGNRLTYVHISIQFSWNRPQWNTFYFEKLKSFQFNLIKNEVNIIKGGGGRADTDLENIFAILKDPVFRPKICLKKFLTWGLHIVHLLFPFVTVVTTLIRSDYRMWVDPKCIILYCV